MENMDIKQQCERRFLGLIRDSGLPDPDEIEFGDACVRFMWVDRKVVVVIDIAEFEEADANGGYTREGLTA